MVEDKVYMIGEIGINHNGDLNIAKKLIDAVNACNWDCAKFQKRNPDVCVPEAQKSVMRETPWGKMTYLDLSTSASFMNNYSAALFFPHTDIELFPSVKRRIA